MGLAPEFIVAPPTCGGRRGISGLGNEFEGNVCEKSDQGRDQARPFCPTDQCD